MHRLQRLFSKCGLKAVFLVHGSADPTFRGSFEFCTHLRYTHVQFKVVWETASVPLNADSFKCAQIAQASVGFGDDWQTRQSCREYLGSWCVVTVGRWCRVSLHTVGLLPGVTVFEQSGFEIFKGKFGGHLLWNLVVLFFLLRCGQELIFFAVILVPKLALVCQNCWLVVRLQLVDPSHRWAQFLQKQFVYKACLVRVGGGFGALEGFGWELACEILSFLLQEWLHVDAFQIRCFNHLQDSRCYRCQYLIKIKFNSNPTIKFW